MEYYSKPQTIVRFGDSPSIDAFYRLRTSQPHVIFDSINQYTDPSIYEQTIINASSFVTLLPNESAIMLSATVNPSDYVIRQTKQYFRYYPGKSSQLIMSRVLGTPKSGVRSRIGLFDDYNGLYFESDGSTGTFGVTLRSNTTGSVINNRIPQSSFNLDTLDGNGPSGMSLNLNNDNIFSIDFQWLGAGRIRYGVLGPHGNIIYCHEIINANVNPTSYMTSANLPIRTELQNIGIPSTSTNIRVICTALFVEDDVASSTGYNNSVSNGINTITVTSRQPVLSIRNSSTFQNLPNRTLISNINYSLYSGSNIYYELIYNGSLSGSVWSPVNTSTSAIQYDTNANAITGGIRIDGGYVTISGGVGARGSLQTSLRNKLPFCVDACLGNSVTLSIVATSFTGNAATSGSYTWQETY